jgi:hypothetical protein
MELSGEVWGSPEIDNVEYCVTGSDHFQNVLEKSVLCIGP